MKPIREVMDEVLEHLGVLAPKAEVIDLQDVLWFRRARRRLDLLKLDTPSPDEPPRSA